MNPMPVALFSLPFSQPAVDDLRERLGRTRWLDEIPGTAWEYGISREFMQDICSYWKDQFDWKAQLDRLSQLHHFRFTSGSWGIHFIHERGQGPNPLPLILTHGWPGSFLELLEILPLLTDPAAHGADPADTFDVVIPSLPGYGFSDPPTERGVNTFAIADRWAELMSELGYSRFVAQGGDIGAAVTTLLGLRHPGCVAAIHLNYIPGSYRPWLAPGTALDLEEQAGVAATASWYDIHGAYAHIQRTHPQTAALGLNDSPAGLAAWILEKFRDWSDCNGDLFTRFTRDQLLTNVTLYWMTQTIASSFRLYMEGRLAPLQFKESDFVTVPTGVARFPLESPFPPRRWVERGYNLQRWTEMPRGGHFAAAEEPELLAQEIRDFFRPYR
jgi:pimeloyl-ACP methyl ester carboxylesterase